MEQELYRLKEKHGCGSRLEACLMELDEERRKTSELQEEVDQLKDALEAAVVTK